MQEHSGLIDTHLHLMPGVDDGPSSWEESFTLATALLASGVQEAVVTPHLFHPLWPEVSAGLLRERFQEMRERLPSELALFLGAEHYVCWEFFDQLCQGRLQQLLPLAGSSYLLLEFPPLPAGPPADAVIDESLAQGFLPVLAHPERVFYLRQEHNTLEQMVYLGVRLQLAADSLLDRNDSGVRRCAWRLWEAGLVALVGSDAHHSCRRPPRLKEAFDLCAQRWGETLARGVFMDNPRRVIENQGLETMGRA